MLPYLKWVFTPIDNRVDYVFAWFNENIASHESLKPYANRLTVTKTENDLVISISSGAYSEEDLWKVCCSNKIVLFCPGMNYPNEKYGKNLIGCIIEKIFDVDNAVELLAKFHHRLFEASEFSMTNFESRSNEYESVSLCPAGVLPLIDATEKDLQKTECDEPQKRKAELDAYYQYIIEAFRDYLDGGTPHCFSPYIHIMSFESWRETLPELERNKLAEAEATKKCAKVLDDIKGISNMGGGASCAAS